MAEKSRSIHLLKTLKRVADGVKKRVEEEFSEMELTGSQGMLVGTLAHNGEMKISDLSSRMGLSISTVSGIIDRLEKQGFVERIRSKEDRRVVHVRVTSQFKIKAEKHFNAIEKQLDSIMRRATREEAEKVYEGLEILRRLIEQEDSSDKE